MWSEGVRGATAFLRCGGISETAAACFYRCYKMLERYHRFEDITGLDLHNMDDRALAVLLAHFRGLTGRREHEAG